MGAAFRTRAPGLGPLPAAWARGLGRSGARSSHLPFPSSRASALTFRSPGGRVQGPSPSCFPWTCFRAVIYLGEDVHCLVGKIRRGLSHPVPVALFTVGC